MEKKKLGKVVNDASRKVVVFGNEANVPLKFDKDGNPATEKTVILKRLSLDDLRFLQVWRQNNWDISKTVADTGIDPARSERVIRKLQCFREEDAKVKALAEIPTASWISAKHVENIYEGGNLEDSQQKSLAELAKIAGAYKNTNQINIQNNTFQMPMLTPEQAAELKAIGDRMASVDTEAV